jgi:lysozyme
MDHPQEHREMRKVHKSIIGVAVAASLVVGGSIPYLQQDEGYRSLPYKDIAGVWTDCFGRTGPKVRPGVATSKADCTVDMIHDVRVNYYDPLVSGINGFENLPKDTQIATLRIAYNVGVNGVIGGSIGGNFRRGDYRKACESYMLWDKARVKGTLRVVDGLKKRRAREMAQCLSGLAQGGLT